METNEILAMCLDESGYFQEAEVVRKGYDLSSYSNEIDIIDQLKRIGLIRNGNWVNSDDVDRLVNEIDIYLNGAGGAATQASLVDIRSQLMAEYMSRGVPILSDDVSELKTIIAEAYIIVGSLLARLDEFESERGQAILENLSQAKRIHKNLIPWGE